MSVSDALSPLSAGLAALAEGRWAEAREPLQAAVALDPSAPALEALGHAYFWTDHPDTINVRERAYRAHRDHGDSRGAARVATALAFDLITFQGETAVGQGWLELAGRALEREPLSPEHGHLAAWEADFAITHGDLTLAARKSEEAVSIGRQLGIRDVELIGRAQQGYLLVVQGRAAEGMRLLDASAAAAVAGEFTDRALGGYACCYVISASSGILDLPRAGQWCRRLDDLCGEVGFHALQHFCRVQYAAVLVEQGDWDRAESEIMIAAENLGARRPGLAGEAVIRLAELRRRQGRHEEAGELFAQAEGHPRALLGQAWMALDVGDPGTAAAIASRFVRQAPPQDAAFRSGGLNILVRACVELGNLGAARSALIELTSSLDGMVAGPLRAGVLLSEAAVLLAEGDTGAARAAAEDAIDLYDRAGTPFGAAHARSALAGVLVAAGDRVGAEREADAAARAFEHLGASPFAARARAIVNPPSTPDGPLTRREVEVLRLIAQGLSNADVAGRLVLSEHTVHRHVANALTKLDVSTRAAAVAKATALGLL